MFPHPMSRSEFRPDETHPDLTRLLEENLLAGFPLDLALALVFNELVVRAAEATPATPAAPSVYFSFTERGVPAPDPPRSRAAPRAVARGIKMFCPPPPGTPPRGP